MIVKDEAQQIEATLDNIFAHFPIDYVVIHDTGSTDNTVDLARKKLAEFDVPSEVSIVPWSDFSSNRNLALNAAEGKADYVLFFDADDKLDGQIQLPKLNLDGYTLNVRRGNNLFRRMLIVRNNGSYHWRGVVHEGLYWRGSGSELVGHVDGHYTVISRSLGARSRDPDTYYRDATLLASALNNLSAQDADLATRYAFYCANSYRDAKCFREAIHWYRERISMGGWIDEIYLSHMGAGLAYEAVGNYDDAYGMLLAGHDVAPDRRECLYHLSRILRSQGRFSSALVFAEAGLKIKKPDGGRLFLWSNIYDYWMDYEYLFLKKKMGVEPKTLPQFSSFMSSCAEESAKVSLR